MLFHTSAADEINSHQLNEVKLWKVGFEQMKCNVTKTENYEIVD